MSVHVIAEAGTNHNGSLEKALRLVDVAKQAGADSVKFQMIIPEGLYLPRFFQNGGYSENAVFQKRKAMMLPPEGFARIAQYSREQGIGFGCSVFDPSGLEALDRLQPAYFKFASCDLNNSRLLIEAAQRKRKMIVSTGMATLGEIERAVIDITTAGNQDLVLMHCVSVYPAETARMNLAFIKTLKSAFGLPVGLSDHTERSLAAAIAVNMGVAYIEKHITLNRSDDGFDHAYAMEPEAINAYLADVRQAEEACRLRAGEKVGAQEREVRKRARRGLYAARDLEAGTALAEEDVLVVRPEGALQPNDLPLLLGRKTRRALRRYEELSWGCVEP